MDTDTPPNSFHPTTAGASDPTADMTSSASRQAPVESPHPTSVATAEAPPAGAFAGRASLTITMEEIVRSLRALLRRVGRQAERLTAGDVTIRVSRRRLLLGGGALLAAGGAAAVGKQLHLLSRADHALQRIQAQAQATPAPVEAPPPFPDGPMSTPKDVVIFNGRLADGWDDWSWATHTLADNTVRHEAQPVISMQLTNWQGIQFHTDPFDTSQLAYVQCWARGAGRSGQRARLRLTDENNDYVGSVSLGLATQAGSLDGQEWRLARVSLEALGAASMPISGVVIQALAAEDQGTLYIADLRIVHQAGASKASISSSASASGPAEASA
jgi:hypothetical protein